MIGGGWAGLSAAVHAVQAGWQVRLLEAAPQTGGRARRITRHGLALDNGQHILIGAYRDTLALLRLVGVDPEKHLYRMPLTLRTPEGAGLRLPGIPAPFNVLAAIASAQGWTWQDKWAFIRTALKWQRQNFECPEALTVAGLCQGLPPAVMAWMIEPLCASALNLPVHSAGARVFLQVLKDALMGGPGSSDMLIPRCDQSLLMPDAAVDWLKQRGAELITGHPVHDLSAHMPGPVVLACPAREAARLTQRFNPAWAARAGGLQHTAIATVYLQANTALHWPFPVMALRSNAQAPAQFAFDKDRLSQLPDLRGVIALVVSACVGDRDSVTAAVLQQVREQLHLPGATVLFSVLEKRAAFACTPGVLRPSARVNENIFACGDYVDGPYPSTLEGAVRSGLQAVALLGGPHMGENTA
ncbi:MAG: desaturase [Limnohabitans sp.]|nr:desaturase [Limnohabitans sp.]